MATMEGCEDYRPQGVIEEAKTNNEQAGRDFSSGL